MRINGTKLRKMAGAKRVSIEQLAQAVERTGLAGDRAVSAVQNWMRGSDHPRCKREDIAALAAAVGGELSDIARFECIYKYHRGSPRKAKLLVDLVRGKDYDTARNLLTFTTRRAAIDIRKALDAAWADAQQAGCQDPAVMIVAHSTVGDAPRMKRFQPKDRGRAHPIIKRMTHITIGLEERK